jgi:hypothetical protein
MSKLQAGLVLFVATVSSAFTVTAWCKSSSAPPPVGIQSLTVTPQAATQPSWELVAGVPDSCAVVAPGDLFTTVDINNPSGVRARRALRAGRWRCRKYRRQ